MFYPSAKVGINFLLAKFLARNFTFAAFFAAFPVDLGQESVCLTLFSVRFASAFKINPVYLQCVFHSIRFKVNKGLGLSGVPFFVTSSTILCQTVHAFMAL